MEENTFIIVSVQSMWKVTCLEIDYGKQVAKLNGKKFKLDIKPFVSSLFRITAAWKPVMVNPAVLDGLSCSVHIEKDGEIHEFKGRNDFPDNFREFLYLLRAYKILKK